MERFKFDFEKLKAYQKCWIHKNTYLEVRKEDMEITSIIRGLTDSQ